MSTKKPTSILFPASVEEIKQRLSSVFGLQAIVSAGLVLFDKLPDEKKVELIKTVKADIKNKKESDKIKPDKAIETFRKSARKLFAMKSKDFTTIIATLPEDEQKLLSEIRDKLGPDGSNKAKDKTA